MNTRKLLWLLPCLINALPAHAAESDEINVLKTQVKLLMQRIEVAESKQTNTDGTSMQQFMPTTSENTGNPSISVIGTFAGSSMSGENGAHSDSFLPLSEGEFVFGAAVDAHTRLDVTVTAANGSMGIEEGYLTSKLPDGFRLRVGRKFIPLGRANGVHPHALVYADTPNGLVNLFGGEKLIGEGAFIDRPLYIGDSAHSLLFGFFQNTNDVAFDPTGSNRFGAMLGWTGMWDMDDATTLELGSTFIRARNGISGSSRSDILGGHFAIKNSQFDHSGWSLQGEWNRNKIDKGVSQNFTDGAYLLGEYDFNRNWLAFARYDFSGMTGIVNNEHAYSAGVGWKLSEFQSITLQYKHTSNALTQTASNLSIGLGESANEVFFRWVVAIGPHRPHSY
ncbi:porin family protein [Ghiorsea bivora]|uniref:hypothetical protein n=1 Tax=Ghiorsea bivora TaxID=1485545 RepID=UPI00056DC6D2|nr:hypothetical protein [Ghiorsea bivora]